MLTVKNISISFKSENNWNTVVKNVSFSLGEKQILGIVGESGSGKSVTTLAILGLLSKNSKVTGSIIFENKELIDKSDKEFQKIRGNEIAMIFQEPMTSLNPCFTVGFQLSETLKIHMGMDRAERKKRAIELLDLVGIPEPEKRLSAFPHQLSGGMNQRVMIAMAISSNPRLLIADEPTTALDVTIQAQILDLLLTLQKEKGMSLVLITHDMGVVAETAERVAVQYAGQQVEKQLVKGLFSDPHHPYTQALLNSLPERSTAKILPSIAGVVPGQFDKPVGCLFSPRCKYATDLCRTTPPVAASLESGRALCHYPLMAGLPTNYPEEVSA